MSNSSWGATRVALLTAAGVASSMERAGALALTFGSARAAGLGV